MLSSLLEVPENFYGSREVFSGYMPDQNKYIKAFTYQDDCVVFKGGSQLVSKQLASSKTKRMKL